MGSFDQLLKCSVEQRYCSFHIKGVDHTFQEGALLEPLAVAVHLIRQSGLSFGGSIVVFGAGPVGLLSCAAARAFGASKVIAVDIQSSRLEFAKRFAATATFEPQKSSKPEDNAGQPGTRWPRKA